nr:hypothetical protein CFP56_58069 [Quercus suber]
MQVILLLVHPSSSCNNVEAETTLALRSDSVMANTDSDCDSVRTDPDSDEYDSEVELEIATAYVQLCIEYVQKYYMKRPMCTSILSGRSYVIEVLEGNPQVCYDIFRMDKTIFRHLCNELKRLHLLEEDTGIVSVEEAVGTVLFIVGHNADYRLTANRFQHSLETIQRRFRRALRAIHALGCLIIRPDADAAELPHSLRGNGKYYPWFEDALGHAEYEFPWPPRGSYYLVDSGDATLAGAARVGSGGTEEAFNSRAQREMSEYRDAITAAMWADYIEYVVTNLDVGYGGIRQ